MQRREFFLNLIAGGAVVKKRAEHRNRKVHHENTRLYHGPMLIPPAVVAIVAAHPGIKRTTHQHLVSRYADTAHTWLFRCQIPESRAMVGEIVRAPDGKLRIHCWSAARPADTYREVEEIVAAKEPPVEQVGYYEFADPMFLDPPLPWKTR